MKHYFYFFLALCMGAVVMTSCKPKNNPAVPVEYVLRAKLHADNNLGADSKAEYEKIAASMKAHGYEPGKKVQVSTNDKSKMVSDFLNFANTVKTEVGETTCRFTIELMGIESQYADQNDKNHAWESFDVIRIGTFGDVYDDNWTMDYTGDIEEERQWVDAYVYAITTKDGYDHNPGNDFTANVDLNLHASGDYIYATMKTDGDGVWNPDHADDYITDVIVVYGGDAPESMVVDGRTYRKECNKDLNSGAGGAYIYFYATRDYYYGRYLWVGGIDDAYRDYGCWVIVNSCRPSENFSASHYLQQFIYSDDMEMRVVNAYDSHGNLQGEAEFNHGAGGAFIKMVFCYKKHD